MGGSITSRRTRLTAKQEQFSRLVVEKGFTFVAAFKATYPPRQATRSAESERVAGKRLARNPLVQARMEQLREELLASDPVELRRLALATFADIMSKRLDPRYRRTALDVLHYLDAQERATAAAEFGRYEALTARFAALHDAELALEHRAAAASPQAAIAAPVKRGQARVDGQQGEPQRPVTPEDPQVAERRRAELQQVVAERQRMSRIEDANGPALPKQPSRVNDPQHAAHNPPIKDRESRAVRKPGRFGKPTWMRAPGVG